MDQHLEKFHGDGEWQRELLVQGETLDSMWEYQDWYDNRKATAQKSKMSQAERDTRYGNRPHIKQKNAGGVTVPTHNLPGFAAHVQNKKALDETRGKGKKGKPQHPLPATTGNKGGKGKRKAAENWGELLG